MVFFQYRFFSKNRLKIPKILYEKNGKISIWPQLFFKKEFLNSEIWATLLIFLKLRIRVSKFKSEKGKLVYGQKWLFFQNRLLVKNGQNSPKRPFLPVFDCFWAKMTRRVKIKSKKVKITQKGLFSLFFHVF